MNYKKVGRIKAWSMTLYIYPFDQKYANELMSFAEAKIHLEYLKTNEPNQNHTQIILR